MLVSPEANVKQFFDNETVIINAINNGLVRRVLLAAALVAATVMIKSHYNTKC